MDMVLPIVLLTSLFYFFIAFSYDVYLRKHFVYFRKNSFDELFISRNELTDYGADERNNTAHVSEDQSFLEAIDNIQPVIRLNMKGNIIAANDLYRNVLGLTKNDLVGRNYQSLVDSSYTSKHEYTQFWEKLNRGESQMGEYKLMGLHGNPVWLEASFIPIKDEYGVPRSVLCLAKNMTGKQSAVEAVRHRLQSLASGDLNTTLDIDAEGEMKMIVDSTNVLVDRLRTLMCEVTEVSKQVNDGATELSENNSKLGHRSKAQMTSVEIVAAAVDGFTQGMQNYSLEVKHITEKTRNIVDKFQRSEKVVIDSLENIRSVGTYSTKMSDVLDQLDENAFQTNVLALNAAMEAAKVGEQGQGFAQLANEVREQANQSAQAVQQIKVLVFDNRNAVDKALARIEGANTQFNELAATINEVTSRVAQIENINKAQAISVSDVVRPVVLLNDITQENLAMVEQSYAYTRALQEQSLVLTDRLSFFHNDTPLDSEDDDVDDDATLRSVVVDARVPEKYSTKLVAPNDTDTHQTGTN